MENHLKNYRRRFRIWCNDRRLELEAKRYAAAFADRILSIPDEEAIYSAVRKQFPHLIPKPKGQLNILAVYHHYNWEDTALKPALERFGSVHHYDWMTSFRKGLTQWNRSMREDMNKDLLKKAGEIATSKGIDVIFAYLSGEQVSPDTMRSLQSFGAPLINLALNDKENFIGKIRSGQAMGARDICRFFTLNWTSTEDAVKKYCVEGAMPIYMPEGANPDIHRPLPLEKTIDVSFIGQRYGNREETIIKLQKAGIKVEAFGAGWPNGPLSTTAMVDMYSKSRINLGFGGVIGHSGAFCLKGRDFEVPMSGGLYLTEYHPELEKVYNIGKEIVTYRNFDDLLTAISNLLNDPDKADEIRRRGFERARRDHTWEMRFEKIFRILGLIPWQR
ncbi:MAG: hypothetical protein CSYNP_00017 [Syntrophus sp. SKADARSKE-3]|nr:hypothetical protein [Syntrophus sp. SKADARSKE-3]